MFTKITQSFKSFIGSFSRQGILKPTDVRNALSLIEESLLQADVPYDVTKLFVSEMEAELIDARLPKSVNPQEFVAKIVRDKITAFLQVPVQSSFNIKHPGLTLVMGLQGAGKTTTIAKLAALTKEQSTAPVLVTSLDYTRPAAVDQLEILCAKADIPFYRPQASTVLNAAREVSDYCLSRGITQCYIDTAGRMHLNDELIHEIQEVAAIVRPTATLLVLDAMVGQESLRLAQEFHKAVPVSGVILTKIDSDTRGGAAFGLAKVLQLPILYLGSGEGIADLEVFKAERFARRLLGYGDLDSLAEKADRLMKKEEQADAQKRMMSGSMTLSDFASYLDMMSRLGSLGSLAQYLPSSLTGGMSADALSQAEVAAKKFRVMIDSMTRREQLNPSIIDSSRQARIARGSGVSESDVRAFLKQFNQLNSAMKQMSSMSMTHRFRR